MTTTIVSAAARPTVPQPEQAVRVPLTPQLRPLSATLQRLLAADKPDGPGFQSSI